jgi:hypothetical protein
MGASRVMGRAVTTFCQIVHLNWPRSFPTSQDRVLILPKERPGKSAARPSQAVVMLNTCTDSERAHRKAAGAGLAPAGAIGGDAAHRVVRNA